MNKINVDENFWYIENFLTQKEIDIILEECNKNNNKSFSEGGWVFKSDSVERNINNIALKNLIEIDTRNIFTATNGIFERIKNVTSFLGEYKENYTIQKLIPISPKNWKGQQVALDFHYENSDKKNLGMIAGIIIYLNDNFKGGELIFKNKSFKLKPKPGMFVCIPATEEYSHAVTHVLENERLTFYGHIWENMKMAPVVEPKDYRINKYK